MYNPCNIMVIALEARVSQRTDTSLPYFPQVEIRGQEIDGHCGQLTLMANIPDSLKRAFQEDPPWYKAPVTSEDDFSFGATRKSKRMQVGDTTVIVKKSEETIFAMRHAIGEGNTLLPRRDLPLAQFTINETARRIYEQVTGRQLPLEVPLAVYTDLNTGETYMAYAFAEQSYPEKGDEAEKEAYIAAYVRGRDEIWAELNAMGIYNPVDPQRNILVVATKEQKFSPFIIDTQFWTIDYNRARQALQATK